MTLSLDELRRAPAVQIRNVTRDRWLRLKGTAPKAVFGEDGTGREALVTQSPGGELGFLFDERCQLTVWRSGTSGFGGGSDLVFAQRIIESFAKQSRAKVLDHAEAGAARQLASALIRPR